MQVLNTLTYLQAFILPCSSYESVPGCSECFYRKEQKERPSFSEATDKCGSLRFHVASFENMLGKKKKNKTKTKPQTPYWCRGFVSWCFKIPQIKCQKMGDGLLVLCVLIFGVWSWRKWAKWQWEGSSLAASPLSLLWVHIVAIVFAFFFNKLDSTVC